MLQPSSRWAIWPLLTALAAMVAGMAIVGVRVAHSIDHFTYPMDDTYILMAMARNAAQSGAWGVNPNEYAPASSSPAWTILVAAVFKVAGAHSWAPLVLDVICGISLLLTVEIVGRKEGWPVSLRICLLLALVVAMPVVPMIFSGLEHLLHTVLTILVLYLVWRFPPAGRPVPFASGLGLLIACGLVTAVRFEGTFLGAAVGLFLLVQRRWLLAVGVVAASWLPVAIVGAWSVSNGWGWLPSSVSLKGNVPHNASLLQAVIGTVERALVNARNFAHPHIASAVITPLLALALLRVRPFPSRLLWLVAVFLLVFVQHVLFASTGWFFRYEAYLMAAQILVLAFIAAQWWSDRSKGLPLRVKYNPALIYLALALVFSPQVLRGARAFLNTPLAMKNIHDQQYQMAKFVHRYYPNSVVAANDIGELCYDGSARIVDLAGLGDRAMFKARITQNFKTKVIEGYCANQKVEIAMAYESWFIREYTLPKDWHLAGRLKIEHNVVCGDETVSFFAVNPNASAKLVESLKDFAHRGPADVHIETF